MMAALRNGRTLRSFGVNGAPSDLASARPSFSHFWGHSSLVAQLVRLAQILSLERQRRRTTDLYRENGGQKVRVHFTFAFSPSY